MKPLATSTMILVLLVGAAGATGDEAAGLRIIEMTVDPAAEPAPALRHRLLPDPFEQEPGNAALLYWRAIQLTVQDERWDRGRIEPLLDAPLEGLPAAVGEELPAVFMGPAAAMGNLRALEQGARRERCDWETQIRSDGFAALLPEVNGFRVLASAVALRARVAIAEGDHERALHELRTGMAMARHQAEGPSLIQGLVGAAMAGLMADQIETFVAQPGAPNLYWALAALPEPYIDLRRAIEHERVMLYFQFPELRAVARREMTRREWEAAGEKLHDAVSLIASMGMGPGPPADHPGLVLWLMSQYAPAKRYLVERGRSPEQVDAMPVPQVLAIYALEPFDYWMDEMVKPSHLPFHVAHERYRAVSERFEREVGRGGAGQPFVELIPSIWRAHERLARLDQRLAALRCIEAIRMYAAEHDGGVPGSLDELTVAAPLDPITGEPFAYEAEGRTFTLDAAAPAAGPPVPDAPAFDPGRRYRVTIEPAGGGR